MTNTKKEKVNELSDAQKVGIGASLAAAALAAAAGTYFLYGSKKADKNRQTVKSWMLKARAEVLEGLEKAQSMSKKDYETLVKAVTGAYSEVQDISKKDLVEFSRDMKGHWEDITKTATKALKQASKPVVAKKATAPVKKDKVEKTPVAKKAPAKKAVKKEVKGE